MKGLKELSLRPYTGRLFFAKSRKAYQKKHQELFAEPDILESRQVGRMSGGKDEKGAYTYLIYAEAAPQLAHELSHVILSVFGDCGIDPREANGEPFCYMLSQLMQEAAE